MVLSSDPNSQMALRSGDIDIAMYFDGRAWAEHDANNPDIGYQIPLWRGRLSELGAEGQSGALGLRS
jgi:hypothetical protein